MKEARPARAVAVVMGLLAAFPVWAEVLPPAIGRISYGIATEPGEAVCTGVLVAPDLVLTAGHCVRGAAADPQSVQFFAGWSAIDAGGGPAGWGKAAEVILLPSSDSPGLEHLLQDVALVVLEAPFPVDAFPPLPIAGLEDGPLTLIGFARSAPDVLPQPALCRPVLTPPGLLALDCPVVSGNSGAPLLQWDGSGWRVVAVMVASANGRPVRSWAVLPPAPLQLRIGAATE
ncbi:MAG: trypsin-like serine protease [Rhodobacteraceae bacterium]|nr:trypsin-like serine protease [Paracoccaceae bacterium]